MKDFILWLAFLCFLFVVLPLCAGLVIEKDKSDDKDYMITVYDHNTKDIYEIELEEYLVGVVSAEMPASFSDEALKSQAVAARSYAMRKINSDSPEHDGADLCTDYAHCQAYSDEKSDREKWKDNYDSFYRKIKKAVDDTCGEYLEYNDEIAITVFHSCSNGITEKASDVWGSEVDYLTNVVSEGDLNKNDYITETVFSKDEFSKRILTFLKTDSAVSDEYIGDYDYTTGNNIAGITFMGSRIKGTDVRKIFNLKSSSFIVTEKDDKIIFTVYGSGHGVGMSQYGADAMAKNGCTYDKILSHYYPGTKLVNMYK